ncbi:MAG TPA: response regulator transcription factor [Vicinamibacterales bacterium]|nr:response regulator transcription factor [Vicinamibacterales bacterium]
MAYRILVIEDEPEMQLMLRDNLQYEGYEVLSAQTGELGLELGLSKRPDLVLLDVVLPRMTGYSVCHRLRSSGFDSPIIMITARNTETDRITGLDLGADDYLGKPFSVSELLARVRAQLRRQERDAVPGKFTFGRITVDLHTGITFRDSVPVELSSHESKLLTYLIRHEGQTLSRDQLLRDVWGYPELPLTRTVDNFIARLRGKLEDNPHQPRHILTVHGIGYRFFR